MNRVLIGGFVGFVLVAGCRDRNDNDAVGRTTLTRAVADTTPCSEAIDQIVTRRCVSAQACAQKLNDASFQADACARNLRSHLQLDLDRSTSCPEDIDHKALNACFAAIDTDTCSRAMASVDQIVACSHMELCGRAFPAPLQ